MSRPRRLSAWPIPLVAAAFLTACAPDGADIVANAAYKETIEAWRSEREATLTEPYGWLSLIGLHPLARGETRVGSSHDADLRLPRGPSLWGVIVFDGETAVFEAADDWDDDPANGALGWRSGETARPVETAGIRFELLERADGPHVRVRDQEGPNRTNFVGLEWYAVDRSWAVDAAFETNPPGTTMRVADVTGEIAERPNPGAVVFSRNGKEYRLQAVQSATAGRLWFIFADGTSGRETYGLGRFLYAEAPRDGRVLVDFNQAYNPPCAFSEHTTCPLPPPANRLDLRIEAGELAYTGAVGLRPASVRDPLP